MVLRNCFLVFQKTILLWKQFLSTVFVRVYLDKATSWKGLLNVSKEITEIVESEVQNCKTESWFVLKNRTFRWCATHNSLAGCVERIAEKVSVCVKLKTVFWLLLFQAFFLVDCYCFLVTCRLQLFQAEFFRRADCNCFKSTATIPFHVPSWLHLFQANLKFVSWEFQLFAVCLCFRWWGPDRNCHCYKLIYCFKLVILFMSCWLQPIPADFIYFQLITTLQAHWFFKLTTVFQVFYNCFNQIITVSKAHSNYFNRSLTLSHWLQLFWADYMTTDHADLNCSKLIVTFFRPQCHLLRKASKPNLSTLNGLLNANASSQLKLFQLAWNFLNVSATISNWLQQISQSCLWRNCAKPFFLQSLCQADCYYFKLLATVVIGILHFLFKPTGKFST